MITWLSSQTATASGTGSGYLDVDVSGVTGYVSAKHDNGVAICRYKPSVVNCDFEIRLNGDTSTPTGETRLVQNVNYIFYCPLDASGIFEAANGSAETNYTFEVLALVDAADVHIFSAYEETTVTAANGWTDITPTASGGDTVYAAFGWQTSTGGGTRGGLRSNGSTQDLSVVSPRGGFLVACNAGVFECYNFEAGSSLYTYPKVMGYFKNGTDYVWDTGDYAVIKSDPTAATWIDGNLVHASATSAFVHAHVSLNPGNRELGIRAGDSADTTVYESHLSEVEGWPVQCDASGEIDVYGELGTTDFYLIGYETAGSKTIEIPTGPYR